MLCCISMFLQNPSYYPSQPKWLSPSYDFNGIVKRIQKIPKSFGPSPTLSELVQMNPGLKAISTPQILVSTGLKVSCINSTYHRTIHQRAYSNNMMIYRILSIRDHYNQATSTRRVGPIDPLALQVAASKNSMNWTKKPFDIMKPNKIQGTEIEYLETFLIQSSWMSNKTHKICMASRWQYHFSKVC